MGGGEWHPPGTPTIAQRQLAGTIPMSIKGRMARVRERHMEMTEVSNPSPRACPLLPWTMDSSHSTRAKIVEFVEDLNWYNLDTRFPKFQCLPR